MLRVVLVLSSVALPGLVSVGNILLLLMLVHGMLIVVVVDVGVCCVYDVVQYDSVVVVLCRLALCWLR